MIRRIKRVSFKTKPLNSELTWVLENLLTTLANNDPVLRAEVEHPKYHVLYTIDYEEDEDNERPI